MRNTWDVIQTEDLKHKTEMWENWRHDTDRIHETDSRRETVAMWDRRQVLWDKRRLIGTGDVRKETENTETGYMRQDMWDRRQETWDRRRETWAMRCETGDKRLETGDMRQGTEDVRQETLDRRLDWDRSHETWNRRREKGDIRHKDVRQEMVIWCHVRKIQRFKFSGWIVPILKNANC